MNSVNSIYIKGMSVHDVHIAPMFIPFTLFTSFTQRVRIIDVVVN